MATAKSFIRHVKKCKLVILEQGIVVGRPKDVVVDPSSHRVAAILVSRGRVPQTHIVCRTEVVEGLLADVLTIHHAMDLQLVGHDEAMMQLIRQGGTGLRGRRVFSAAGTRLGRIFDIRVDETGKVVEYRTKPGGILGWLRRPYPAPPESIDSIGGDVVTLKVTRLEEITRMGVGDASSTRVSTADTEPRQKEGGGQ